MSIKRIAHQKGTQPRKKTLADVGREAAAKARRQAQSLSTDQEILQAYLNNPQKEDHAMLKRAVDSYGTAKQRREFEALEKSWFGKTSKQMKNAELLADDISIITQAQTQEELNALRGTFGKMDASQALNQAFHAQEDEIMLNHLIKEEELMQAFHVSPLGNAKPTSSSGKTYAELYEKRYGTKAPAIDVSGVVKAERNAAPILEANARIAEQTSEIEQLRGGITQYQDIVHSQTMEMFDKEAEIARQADTIATQTDTIAQQTNKMTQQGQTIQNLSKANKLLKFGAIGALLGLVGVTVYMIYDKMTNKNQGVPDAPQDNNTPPVEQAQVQEQEEPVVAQQDTVVAQQDNVPAGNPDFTRLVKHGDTIWNYVKDELTEKYGRVPKDYEILEGVQNYMQKHNIPLEDDNYTAIIEPGDSLFQVEA